MSEPVKLKGIVVNAANMGDNDKMLTVLTDEMGVISVSARGVKSLKNKNSQSVMPLCYSSFVLKEKGDIFSLVSADIIESFYKLRENVEALAFGVYFAQLAAFTVGRNNPAHEELRLVLNSLYLLAKSPERCFVLCCAFELKICEYAGIAPLIDDCSCGGEGAYFDALKGECVCRMHKSEASHTISAGARAVCEYVLNADMREALLFDTQKSIAREVSCLMEEFMVRQLGKLPKSYDYIKKIIN